MKILISIATVCLVLAAVVAGDFQWPVDNDRARTLQAEYDNATAWTWTSSRGSKVKRDNGCFTRWMDFKNRQTPSGWDMQTTGGNQNPDWEGWLMHSKPGSSKRERERLI